MNIPNMISIFRICLVPVFAALYTNGRVMQAMAVLLISAASDVLDGAIARRYHMVTDLGKILDPVADKLIQAAMMLCAASVTPTVWLLLVLHLLRECTLALLGLHVMRVSGHVYSAKWYGKVCTAVIYAVMMSMLAYPQMPAGLADTGVLLCALLVAVCLCMYLTSFLRILRYYDRADS